jgi:dTDP-4-amino-4,6-dideoxygalactose transaminase
MAVIPFFKPTITGNEAEYVNQVLFSSDTIARKQFTTKCEKWFAENHGVKNFFLTKSCTHALELAALILEIQPGDEVIMPSFAFVSCANAFALRGATCVFVNVHPGTMNIDENDIEKAITPKTKVIVTINYASISCNYPAIKEIASKYGLYVVEDNAHGIGAKKDGNFLGTFGDISTFSFDHLKNITCIQGGGIAINNEEFLEKFYLAYEFGTNRRSFFKGKVDRYEWKGLGSNFPLAELNAAMLYSQLENIVTINASFVKAHKVYESRLGMLQTLRKIRLAEKDINSEHNAHCVFVKTNTPQERNKLADFLQANGVGAQFHYTNLHDSEFGKTVGRFYDNVSSEANCLLRLPVYYSITQEEVERVVQLMYDFYSNNNK